MKRKKYKNNKELGEHPIVKDYLEHSGDTIVSNILCNRCGNHLPPHTWKEHFELGYTFLPEWYTCPHIELTAEEIRRN